MKSWFSTRSVLFMAKSYAVQCLALYHIFSSFSCIHHVSSYKVNFLHGNRPSGLLVGSLQVFPISLESGNQVNT